MNQIKDFFLLPPTFSAQLRCLWMAGATRGKGGVGTPRGSTKKRDPINTGPLYSSAFCEGQETQAVKVPVNVPLLTFFAFFLPSASPHFGPPV